MEMMEMTKSSMEWTDRAPQSLVFEQELEASCGEVFEILADVDSWPEWFPEFRRVEWVTGGEPGVGSRRQIWMGPLRAEEEFLVWEPGERFAFTMTKISLPLAERLVEDYRLTAIGEGKCRLDWTVYFEPPWFLAPAAPLVVPAMRWSFGRAMASLAEYVRSGE
jgi:uncharacterized protein YndB with AHSA1/START domain